SSDLAVRLAPGGPVRDRPGARLHRRRARRARGLVDQDLGRSRRGEGAPAARRAGLARPAPGVALGPPDVLPRAAAQRAWPAPSDGGAWKASGRAKPGPAKAEAIAEATCSACSASTRALVEPPKPPPVIRAPWAPAARAASTAVSSGATVTS